MPHSLEESIHKCKQSILGLRIKHLTQTHYEELVERIFSEICKPKNIGCPEKLEPQSEHLPKESIKILQQKYGLGRSEN